jgi:hypothetical protein
MDHTSAKIDHEAIRTGAIPWSADELDYVLQNSRGGEEALHVASARARDLGLDTGTSMAHGMRLFAIMDFLHDHHDRLYECGLLLPRDQEKDLISGHLLEVLATFPFTAPTGEKASGGRQHLGFDADDVIIEAGRRQKANDEVGRD